MDTKNQELSYRWRSTADGILTEAGGEIREVLGYEPSEVIGRSIYEFIHPSDLGVLRQSHSEAIVSPLRATRRYRLRRKDGGYLWVESTRRSTSDDAGNVVRIDAEVQPLAAIASIGRLIEAIDRREFVLHYQPIVEIATGRVTHYEALARWKSAGTIIGPAGFIPLAEQSGVVRVLTQLIIDLALADVPRLSAGGHCPIAVNISGHDLADPLIAIEISGKTAAARLHARDLVLEITETAVAEGDSFSLAGLQQLAATGFALSIDDFGAGQSSLQRLATMPVREIKIDGSLTAHPERTGDLLRMAVAIGAERGLRVIAECVESEAQLEALRNLGLTEAQGYYIARPMPAGDVPAWRSGWTAPWLKVKPRLRALG